MIRLALALAPALLMAWASTADASSSPGRLEALLINGGGRASSNYQSHLLHVRELVDVLRRSGVPDERITVLASDGADPSPDLALRELQPEDDFWLLSGTRLEKRFRTATTLESSTVTGLRLRPATPAAIQKWFAETGARLRGGDTLLLYVTDHGTRNKEDPRNNRITLWGQGKSLSVDELRAHLDRLDPAVRVLTLMSQCYSGSFAHLALDAGQAPRGNVCGYFSTTAERRAHGCYPEDRGAENIGHSFEFLQELASGGSFRNAHLRVLGQDVTPDVPVRTSDLFLEEVLAEAAAVQGKDLTTFVDGLLAQAWRTRATWEPEIRLLDAIGQQFGTFSPRSLGEIEEQAARLLEVSRQLTTHGRAWKASLGDANRANITRFLAKDPSWAEQVREATLKDLGPEGVRGLAGPFLAGLADHTRGDTWTSRRLETLRQKSERAAEAAYRMEVRLGVILRMRTVLETVAGRVFLATRGAPEQRAAYDSLLGCEGLSLPVEGAASGPALADRPLFPAFEEDLDIARDVLPGWLGIRFRPVQAGLRSARELTPGAAALVAVYPDSPAQEAGLQVGDVVLGPPDAPFQDAGQIREWTMLAAVDVPAPLAVLRGEERVDITITPRSYPLKWPKLPGPPRVSESAPELKPLRLQAYSGLLPGTLGSGTPHLLFFWATWCGPCKAALPELMAFERERQTPVIAITDEPEETLDAFFSEFDRPFPERVGTDEARRAFHAYGISGTPTFIVVDGEGVIRSYSVGYSPHKSLGVEGWRWPGSGRSAGAREQGR